MTAMRHGWLHLASGAGVGRVFGFLSNLLLSRWLGPAELGLFNLVTTTIQTSDTLARCGGDYALNFELGGQPEATKTEHGVQLARALSQICTLMAVLICVVVLLWIWCGHGLFPTSLAVSQRQILSGLLVLMIACECAAAPAWEVLLISHRTALLAFRQGLFFPLRLLFAAVGALLAGVLGAMGGWSLIALVQCLWLKIILKHLWKPLEIWPILSSSVSQLLKRGLPFYTANFLASMIFYPLLIKVADGSGLSEIGFLRVGQILQQLFAFIPATLVPVLFLKLRAQSDFEDQISTLEKPTRLIWLFLLEALLLYCMFDQFLIAWIFGAEFISALMPTRLLLTTALFECIAQLLVQPILATGKTGIYGFWQNASAVLAAVLGWLWIPSAGIAAYLVVRLLYVIVPLLVFGIPMLQHMQEPNRINLLALVSFALPVFFLVDSLNHSAFTLKPYVFMVTGIAILALYRHDLLFLRQMLSKKV